MCSQLLYSNFYCDEFVVRYHLSDVVDVVGKEEESREIAGRVDGAFLSVQNLTEYVARQPTLSTDGSYSKPLECEIIDQHARARAVRGTHLLLYTIRKRPLLMLPSSMKYMRLYIASLDLISPVMNTVTESSAFYESHITNHVDSFSLFSSAKVVSVRAIESVLGAAADLAIMSEDERQRLWSRLIAARHEFVFKYDSRRKGSVMIMAIA